MWVKIIKLENGNVRLEDESGSITSLPPSAKIDIQDNGLIRIRQQNEACEYIDHSKLQSTQILPAVAVPFDPNVTSVIDLVKALDTDFFFVDSSSDAIDVTYDNSASGLAATDVQSAIDELAGEVVAAADVTYNNLVSGLAATNIQAATDEVSNNIGKPFIYPSSYYQNHLEASHTQTGVPPPLNIRAYPIWIKTEYTINSIRAVVNTPAAGNFVFGVYDSLNGLPNNLIFQTTAFDKSIAGAHIQAVPSITLKRGLYFVALNASNSTGLLQGTTSVGVLFPLVSDFSGGGNFRGLEKAYTYTGTLPATFGTGVIPYSGYSFCYLDFKQ